MSKWIPIPRSTSSLDVEMGWWSSFQSRMAHSKSGQIRYLLRLVTSCLAWAFYTVPYIHKSRFYFTSPPPVLFMPGQWNIRFNIRTWTLPLTIQATSMKLDHRFQTTTSASCSFYFPTLPYIMHQTVKTPHGYMICDMIKGKESDVPDSKFKIFDMWLASLDHVTYKLTNFEL